MISADASNILRTVPREKAFYFFTSIGNYTGVNASSLKEFSEKMNDVNDKSLEFHLCRGDFDKWISEVLQDTELALEIKRMLRQNLTGDVLRSQLSDVISKRLKRLAGQLNPSQV